MNAPPVKIAVASMAIGALVITLLGTAHVARQKQIIRIGYELSKAMEELSRNQEENRRLRLDKSMLTSPERIQGMAAERGMRQPGPEQIRVIPSVRAVSRADQPAGAVAARHHAGSAPPPATRAPTSGI